MNRRGVEYDASDTILSCARSDGESASSRNLAQGSVVDRNYDKDPLRQSVGCWKRHGKRDRGWKKVARELSVARKKAQIP